MNKYEQPPPPGLDPILAILQLCHLGELLNLLETL